MTDNGDSITDTQEQIAPGLVLSLQSKASATVSKAHRRLKSLFGFLTNDAAISQFIHEERCSSGDKRLGGIRHTIDRIAESPFYSPSANSVAPYGYFCGRPIIGDSSPISGGIYLSSYPAEALVVDEKYDSLRQVLKEYRARVSSALGQNTLNDHQLLKLTMRFVREVMALDTEAVSELNSQISGSADKKVALDSYLNAGCGASRHLVLLAGFLLEGLKKLGMAVGNPSIDTSQAEERLIYTSINGDLFVIDFSKAVLEAGH